MYLKEFKDDKIKTAIIDLCLFSAEANDVIDDSEISLIKDFCTELNYPFYDKPYSSYDEAIGMINQHCSVSEKKKIIMEILAVMLSDGSCDDKEFEFVKGVAKEWNVSATDVEEFHTALSQLYIMYANINSLVEG